MGPVTFNELGAQMLAILEEQIESDGRSESGRDLNISKTHLEDSMTRYNSAQHRRAGTWKRDDPDKPEQ